MPIDINKNIKNLKTKKKSDLFINAYKYLNHFYFHKKIIKPL